MPMSTPQPGAPETTRQAARHERKASLPKAPSGIRGLDDITGGGLPRGRPTLVCGGTGCGKTLFAMEFLVRGALEHGEPGVFMAFEETAEELGANVASLGFDLRALQEDKLLAIDFVSIDRSQLEESGEYDLSGLFIRLEQAITSIGAKRIVLDTVESLFTSLPNALVVRSELRRLFRWLKGRDMTVVITGERGDGALTREGLEEYVSDCVISLDHRVSEQACTRRLRVVKYRGSLHGTNEYPFLIDEDGISIVPVTSVGLAHVASTERVSSGIARLDEMLDGEGFFKGSTILLSGTAGTGKTSVAVQLARATCARGGRCLYYAFEESEGQIVRNMHSMGTSLEPFLEDRRLEIVASRPSMFGLEMHLMALHKAVARFDPEVLIIDPITKLVGVATAAENHSMMARLIDFLKVRGTTALFTSMTAPDSNLEESDVGISSLIDTWIMIQVVRAGTERNRALSIIKSRGMAHSNQTTEFVIASDGIQLVDTYLGTTGVLTGSARATKEAEDLAALKAASEELDRKVAERARRYASLERQIIELREQFKGEDGALEQAIHDAERRRDRLAEGRAAMGRSRQAFGAATKSAAGEVEQKEGHR